MSTPDPTVRSAHELPAVLDDAVRLTAEGVGLREAVQVRGELRALSTARAGRLVVLGERGRVAVEVIAALLGMPRLATTLRELPRAHTTYRFSAGPRLIVTTHAGERQVALRPDGSTADEPASILDGLTGRVLHVDVGVPAPVLSWFAVSHPPDLHRPGTSGDPLLTLTPDAVLAYVTTSSVPLSAAEVELLRMANARVRRSAVLLTGVDSCAGWREVAAVDDALLRRPDPDAGATAAIIAVGERDGVSDVDELRGWLQSAQRDRTSLTDGIGLVRNVADTVLASPGDRRPRAGRGPSTEPEDLAAAVRAAETDVAQVVRASASWLPRLAFEFTRLRSELGERSSQALVQLEQRYDQAIQSDVGGVIESLPVALLDELRGIERRTDDELVPQLEAVAEQFLGGRFREFLPGGARSSIAPPDVGVRLLDVSEMHVDRRAELFAGMGNFGSGRQSLSLVSTVATAASVPVALIGSVIGLGFWKLGRQSRQDSQSRLQASRWLKVQVAEAGRVVRYRIDQELNQAQLALNLAVRDFYDRTGAEARAAVEAARTRAVAAEAAQHEQMEREASRRARAQDLLDRVGALASAQTRGPSTRVGVAERSRS